MANVTLSIQNQLLKACRDYVKKHNLSLNALVRHLLEKTVTRSSSNKAWLEECFSLMDRTKANSHHTTWKREDLYRV